MRFLNEKCAGNEILRREVEALLALHRRAGSFIETPIADVASGLLKRGRNGLADWSNDRPLQNLTTHQCRRNGSGLSG